MPHDKEELLASAKSLTGRTLGELAQETQFPLPTNAKNAKGWVGELMERCLGATAGNRSAPDFESLGIELKTLPLNARLEPKESTFVCYAALAARATQTWETSAVAAKLQNVLWVPVEADPALDLTLRRVGKIFLWSPSTDDWRVLKSDWEEHMETIALGQIGEIDGRRGQYLQLRPKAYSSKVRTTTFDQKGNKIQSNPRGFYLRRSFTLKIFAEQH